MNQKFYRSVVFLAVAVLVAFGAFSVAATTLDVCASGCTFDSVQGAVAAANAGGGDVISLGAGVFIGPVQVAKTVDIVGTGANSVIGGGLIVGGLGITVNVSNLTLTKGLNGLAVLGASTVVVRDATIAGNISDGVLVGDVSSVTLFNTVVANNGSVIAGNPIGAGISANGAATVTTSAVTVTGNMSGGIVSFGKATLNVGTLTNVVGNGLAEGVIRGFGGEGIVVAGASNATIDGALIQGNGASGVAVFETGTATVQNSQIKDNLGPGVRVGGPASANPDVAFTATATIKNNTISGNGSHGVLVGDPGKVLEGANATVVGNGISNNGGCGVGIDAQGATAAMSDNFFSGNPDGNTCSL